MRTTSDGLIVRGGRSVPYIVPWDSEVAGPESELAVDVAGPEPRLAYTGVPRPTDRGFGFLWARMSSSPGVGRPLYRAMHASRQYMCMYGMRCQLCGGPAARNDQGWLFLDWRTQQDPDDWPEGTLTAQPPLCEGHARQALEQCPHLRQGSPVVLRVRSPRVWGASGALYTLTSNGWSHDEGEIALHKDDGRRHGLLASNLVRQLVGVSVADLS
ncbi:hypothetical protein [Streptomyces sp. NPDC048332]|uniref:hypothetical protein n=1 Tax=Streptomyces sp. NPDC048332 TaxID=3154619 RepID=UPI0034339389